MTVPGYEILGELGRGGMGVVYHARHTDTKRVVALKMILGGGHADPVAQARFLIEAEVIARLDHPQVVKVYDFGRHDGQAYFALEYVAGGSLKEELARRKCFAPRDAAELVAMLADGVAHAHSRGVIHRDLKPGNVLLANPERERRGSDAPPTAQASEEHTYPVAHAPGSPGLSPKITDFGLAKVGESDVTATGALLGTPSYMSPEQAAGRSRQVGPAADVWALGAILYDLLAGRTAFKGDTWEGTIRQVLDKSPDRFHVHVAGVPRDVETICFKCLEKEPTKRYASADALAADLRAWLDGRPITARPAGPVERAVKFVRRNAVLTGAVVAVLLAMAAGTGVSLWQAGRADDEATNARGQATRADDEATTAKREADRARAAEKLADDRAAEARDERDRADTQATRARWQAFFAGEAERDTRLLLDHTRIREAHRLFGNNQAQLGRDTLAEVDADNRCLGWRLVARQGEGSLFTLYGHTGWVTVVAWSPDGCRILTGANDQTVRTWDAATGEPLGVVKGPGGEIRAIWSGPAGVRVVTLTVGTAQPRIWDGATGRPVADLKGHAKEVRAVAFSADGTRVVTGSEDGTARVWDAASGRQIAELQAGEEPVTHVAFDLAGTRVTTLSADGTTRVWAVASGRRIVGIPGERDFNFIAGVGFSPDGTRLIAGAMKGVTRVWDAATGLPLVELKGQAGGGLAFSPDGTRILTDEGGSPLPSAGVWDAATGRPVTDLRGHTGGLTAAAFSPDGTRLVTGSRDRTARVWDAATGRPVAASGDRSAGAVVVAVSADGNRVATVGQDGTARVRDAATGRVQAVFTGPELMTWAGLSLDGSRLATLSADGVTRVWATADGRATALPKLADCVAPLRIPPAFSPDGSRLVTAWGHDARVWDAATGRLVTELTGLPAAVTAVGFSPDGTRVVAGSGQPDPALRVWDVADGRPVATLTGLSQLVLAVAFSPDGTRVAAGVGDSARVWDVADGRPVATLTGHAGGVRAVAFSPDGTRVVTGAYDGTVRLWDAATGRVLTELRLAELRDYVGGVESVAVSPDGSRLVTTAEDGTVWTWDAVPTQVVVPLAGPANEFFPVRLSSDGRRAYQRVGNQEPILWDATTGRRLDGEPVPADAARWPTALPDGTRVTVSDGRASVVSPPTADEIARRRARAAPNAEYHRLRAAEGAAVGDAFAEAFHLRRLLMLVPDDTEAQKRLAALDRVAPPPRAK